MPCRCLLCGRRFLDFEDLADHLATEHEITLHEMWGVGISNLEA